MAGQVISRLTSSGGNDAGVHVISSSFYGVCYTAADEVNKEIIIQNRNVSRIEFTKGMLLAIKFMNKNDVTSSLPTFQLFKNNSASNNTPSKGEALANAQPVFAQQNTNIKPTWSAGSVVTFVYDTYTRQNQDGTFSTVGCWIKTAGISEEIFENLNIRIDNVESASTIAIDNVAQRVDKVESDMVQAAIVGDIEFIYWPMDSTETPPVTPAASYDWEETFNVECEWSTDALPYIFGLDIWQRTKSFTIGNASNPTYSDPIRISGRDGAKGDKGDQGDPGTTGSPAYSYNLVTDVTSLTRNVNTSPVVNNPNSIIFSATKTEGNNAPISYSGQLVVSEYVYDNSTSKWIWRQLREKSLMGSQSIEITPSIAATLVRGILFTVDGTTQLDSQTVPIIETGLNGEDGSDAIIAYLTNESHSFAATASAAVTASVSSQFIVNQGGQELQATIEGISADPLTLPAVTAGALTTTYAGNTFTISINPNFTTTAYSHSGTFSISATASVNESEQTFVKNFSWSLIPAGADGENGVNISNVKLYKIGNSNGVSKPKGDLTYTFNTQELTPTDKLEGWSVNMPDMTQVTPGWSCYLISANAASLEATDVIKGIGYDDSAEDNSDWYGPVVFVQNGKDGKNGLNAYNHATISLYQRYNPQTENDKPSKPGDNTYNFSEENSGFVNSLGNWKLGVDAAENEEPCWITSVNLVSQETTIAVPSNRWSDPVIFTRDGADGEGVSITNREIHYIESDSGTVTPADNAQWKTTVPSVTEGNYLWTRTRVTYSDGNALTSYSVAKQGKGITVTGSSIEYATNNSITTPTSGWQNTPPSTTPGWYIWTKTTTNYSDGSAVTSYSVGKTGTNGSNAYLYELHCSPSVIMLDQNATTPAFAPTSITLSATRTNGNSTPAAYAGRFKLEWSNNNSTWTAVATNGNSNTSSWTQSVASVNTAATSFKATLYTANSTTNVLDTETIPVIRGGKNGINGYNQSTVYLYIRSDSNTQPTKPSNSHTYNFANKTFTDATDDKIENWTINKIPAADGDKIVWMTFAVASSTTSTDEIASTEWSTPVKIEGVDGQQGQPGANGYNQTVVQLYQRYDSQPTKPANNSLTYTFNTNKITGSLNGWSQQIPASNGLPCWITVGVARSQGNSDVIDSWSDPVIYNKDGTDGYNKATIYLYKRAENIPTEGDAKPSGQLTYTFETETLAPANSLNGWSQEIPTTDTTLWMIAAVANSTNSTDTIEVNDWSIPVQMEGINGQPGEDGFNQATIDLYKRADSAPTSSMPGELTYTFGATNPLSTPQNNWSQTIPATNGQPCWVTSGTAVSRNASARISNWSAPTKILEDSVFVNLDNDNITLPTENGIAKPTTITINVSAYKGISQINTSIDNTKITGKISGKISTSVNNNNSKTTQVIITITNQLTTDNEKGILTIPVTAAGVTINKQFTWSLFENGLNQATLYLYKRAATASKPTSDSATYNFSSKTLTIPTAWGTGENNLGWQTTFPKGDQGDTTPVWVITAVASSNTNTDTIEHSEWSGPVEWISNGKDGEDAYNQADIFLYRRSVDTPVKPVFSSFTYTFSTGVSGLTTSYATNASPSVTWYTSVTAATVTSGNSKNDYMPCWMATTHPVSQSASIIVTDTWSDPAIFIQPGKGIANVAEYYLATTASTGVTTASSGWKTSLSDAQISATIPYLWNYEVTEYTDGNSRTIAPHIVATYGKDGKNGTSVTITSIKYGKSSSASTEPSNWYNETDWASQSIGTGTWIWVKTTYSNGSTSINKSYVGTNGTNGQPGTSSYTHIAWANSANGQTDFSKTSSTNKTYLGICINNTQSDSSLTYSNYTWSLIQGKSIVSIVNKYKRTTTATRPATTDDDWITPNSNTPIPTVDSTNKYLWTYEVTTYQNPTSTESTQPHLIGAYGDNGIGVSAIEEQQILWPYDDSDTSTHPGPGDNANWQPKGEVIWESGKYIWSQTKVTWTNGKIDYIGRTVAKDINDLNERMRLTNSGSGTIITSNDAANLPPLSLTIHGKSVQDGTPSPSNPVPIRSVESRNLQSPLFTSTRTVNGITYTPNEDGTFTASGTATPSHSQVLSPRQYLPAGDYVISGCPQGGAGKTYYLSALCYSAQTGGTITASAYDYGSGAKFTVPSGGGYVLTYCSVYKDTAAPDAVWKPMLERGSNAHGYQPYGSITLVTGSDRTDIDLQGNAIRSLPDGTRDTLEVDGEGNVTLTKRVGVAVIDGVNVKASGITNYSPNVRANIPLPNQATVGWDARLNTYADKFSVSSAPVNVPAQSASEYTFELYSSYSFAVIPISALSAASTTAVNEWFASNPVTVLYPLAEPQIISLGKIDLPSLPSPSFSMHVDALVTPTLDAEWWTTLGYETGKQHTAANSLLTSLSNEITKTQETLTDNAIIETNQWWFITDKKEIPKKPDEQPFNSNTGDYDNWKSKVSDSYIVINPDSPPSRYSISNNIVTDNYNNNRDVTEFCITVKEDNNEIIWKYYPYNYYCYEYKYLNGAITYSDVVYDSVKSSIAENKIIEDHQNKALEELMRNQNQFFYSDTNGAHVKDTESNYETTWNSSGMNFYKADSKLLTILAIPDNNGIYSGMTIYNGKTGDEEKTIAQFIPNLIQLGSDKEDRLRITREQIEFIKDSITAAYIGTNGFYTPNITVNSSLYLETPKESIESQDQDKEYKWAWIPRSNGNIAFKWVGTPKPETTSGT